MRKAKKLIAGIMLACMFIAGTGVEPSDVYAAGTTAGSLEMKTASDSINLNAGQSFDVTFSVNAETSGFGGYLTYDNSVFTSVTVFAWEFVSVSFCVFSSTSDPFVRR